MACYVTGGTTHKIFLVTYTFLNLSLLPQVKVDKILKQLSLNCARIKRRDIGNRLSVNNRPNVREP
jgi:hypothetical protein